MARKELKHHLRIEKNKLMAARQIFKELYPLLNPVTIKVVERAIKDKLLELENLIMKF